MLNKIAIFLAISILFSACIDLNLKSELPNIVYYKLDTSNTQSPSCQTFEFVALAGINVSKEYQDNRISYKEDGKIKYFNNIAFINNINQSLENIIIKEFDKKCLKVILPPFSGINIETFLYITLLDFDIVKDDKNAKAIINLSYQIISKGNIWKSGIISQEKDLGSFSDENAIKALQEVSLNAIKMLSNQFILK